MGHCRSIEHRYIPSDKEKALMHAEQVQEERAARGPAPDMRDALIVNDAWKQCGPRTKKLLKWSFCMGKRSDQTVCQECRIRVDPPTILALAFYNACKEIERMLDEPAAMSDRLAPDNPRTRADKLPPASKAATQTAPSAVRATPKETEDVD